MHAPTFGRATLVAGLLLTGTMRERPAAPAINPPGITKIELKNWSNLLQTIDFRGAELPYVAPGKTKEIWVTGGWMDYVRSVDDNDTGVSATASEQKMLWGTGQVKITLSGNNAAPGIRTLTMKVHCPVVPTDCNNFAVGGSVVNVPLRVRVLAVGTISAILPNTGVASEQTVRFTVSGSRMDVARVNVFKSSVRNVVVRLATTGQLAFDATTSDCGTGRIVLGDRAFGGEEFPYAPGGIDFQLATSCGYRPVGGVITSSSGSGTSTTTSSAMITGSSTSGAPDLVPAFANVLLRHVAQIRKLTNAFCNDMFAQPTTAVVKTITVRPVRWGVTNTGPVAMPSGVTVLAELRRNGVVVDSRPVGGLAAGASTFFDWTRPQSVTEVARLAQVPDATTRQLYNATGGECVQTVGQERSQDWTDPQYEVRVAPLAGEGNVANNTRSY